VNSKTKAVFLDRDGVINIDKSYVYKIEDFEFTEGIFEVLKTLQDRGYKLFIVTNQSGIGRGYYSEDDFQKLMEYVLKEFEKRDIHIQKVYHCPHYPKNICDCRKPKPGMLLKAKEEFDIDMQNSWMIGDKKSDVEVGKNAGVGKTVFIGENKEPLADYSIDSISKLKDIVF